MRLNKLSIKNERHALQNPECKQAFEKMSLSNLLT